MTPEEISLLYQHGQSETVVFEAESVPPNRLAETIAAFANTDGGVVLLGIDPKTGAVRGVRALDAATDKVLAAGLRCEPPLILPRPEKGTLDGKPVLVVQTPAGLSQAYSLRGKYLARAGRKNVALGPRQLRQLLRERGESTSELQAVAGASLDDLDEALVDKYAEAFLGECFSGSPKGGLATKPAVLELLCRRGCLVKEQGAWHPTLAGYLLFGQEPQRAFPSAEMLLVRYTGKQMSDEFLREVARGPLAEQVRRAEAFIAANTRVAARIEGLVRADRPEYPLPAVREAIVNAVAHRDYAIRGDEIRVTVFGDRIQVYSPGRLPGHVTLDNIVDERFSRNEVIAQVLADLGFIERLGYGIDRMIRLMREWGLPAPRFAETANGFQVTLRGPGDKWPGEDSDKWQRMNLNSRQIAALEFLGKSPRITNRDYREMFSDVSEETIRRDLADLVEQGILLKMGDKRGTFYILK